MHATLPSPVVIALASLLALATGATAAGSAASPVADSTAMARAQAQYDLARHHLARPLLLEAARAYEAAGQRDSAAHAVYLYGATYVQTRDVEALARAHADTLAPWLGRLDTDLARGLDHELTARTAYWRFDWAAALPAYRAALAYYDREDPLAARTAVGNLKDQGYVQVALGDLDSAVVYGERTVALTERQYGPCSRDFGYAHFALGDFLHLTKDYPRASYHYTLAAQALDAALAPEHPHRAVVYSQLGQLQAELGRYDRALAYMQEAFAIAEGVNAGTAYSVAAEYVDLLHYLRLHTEALYWERRARAYALEAYGTDHPFNAATAGAVAAAAGVLEDTALTARYLDTARYYQRRFPAETRFMLENYHSTAGALALARRDFPAATAAYHRARAITESELDTAGFAYRAALHNLAHVHLLAGTPDSAGHYAARLGEEAARHSTAVTFHTLEHDRLIAEVAVARGDYAAAAATLATSLAHLTEADGAGALRLHLFDLAAAAADLQRASPSPRHDTLLVRFARATERALDTEYAFLGAERWTEAFVEALRGVFTTAAFVAAEFAAAPSPEAGAYRRDAVRFADLPRALRLRRRGAEVVAAQYAALPDSILDRGRELRRRLIALEHSDLTEAERAPALRRARAAVARHEDLLRRGYPNYYRAVANPLRLDLDGLRERARRGDARYVSYLVDTAGARVLSAAVSGAPEPSLRVLPLTPTLRRDIAALKDAVTRRRDGATLSAPATEVYAALLRPGLVDADAGAAALTADVHAGAAPLPARLIIAAEGLLADLPFAALLTEAPAAGSAYADWPWVARATAVSYVDALATLDSDAAPPPRRRTRPFDLACVVPGFESREEPVTLVARAGDKPAKLLRTPWTLALAEELRARYGARVLSRAEATEEGFAEAYAEHDVVHLGTHALLDESAPLRSFFALAPAATATPERDGRLYAYELYGLPTAARLAVLPACRSGAGAFSAGEGVLSLATAIRNSGCPTVVQSVWSLDDQQTNAILARFYAGLAEGATVAEALRVAQRDYLAAAPPELQHPYYWAGLASVGPDVRFGARRTPWLWVAAVAGVLLVGGGWWFTRRGRAVNELTRVGMG